MSVPTKFFFKCNLLVVFDEDGSINSDADVTEGGAAQLNVAISTHSVPLK